MSKKEKPETKKCKHCQSDIPYKAKICPYCRKRQKRRKLFPVVVVLILLILFGTISSSSDNSTKKVGSVSNGAIKAIDESETTDGNSESSEEEKYHVGDIIQDGDVRIIYMSSGEYTEGDEYSQPQDGNKYIYLQFAFENTSGDSDSSISFYSFDCYADGYNAEMYYGGSEDLSATLSAGRITTGYIYFEIPENSNDVEVEYTTNAFTEKKIYFVWEGVQDSGYVPSKNTESSGDAYSVGDIAETSDLRITYLSCEDYKSDNYFVEPSEGCHFVTCEFEFENLGDNDEYVTSYDFDCYADGLNCDQTFIRDDDISATISKGHKAKGTVTFEIPDDAVVIEVEYLENYWTSGRIVFTVK